MTNVFEHIPIITVDGPRGSGKGTLSHQLAAHLKWHFLDSGAIYRVLANCAEHHGIAFDDVEGLETLARHLDVTFENNPAKIVLSS